MVEPRVSLYHDASEIAQTNNYIRLKNDTIFILKMSLRQENSEELRIILFEMFAVHIKIVCVYYIFVTLLIGEKNILFYLILSYSILSLK